MPQRRWPLGPYGNVDQSMLCHKIVRDRSFGVKADLLSLNISQIPRPELFPITQDAIASEHAA